MDAERSNRTSGVRGFSFPCSASGMRYILDWFPLVALSHWGGRKGTRTMLHMWCVLSQPQIYWRWIFYSKLQAKPAFYSKGVVYYLHYTGQQTEILFAPEGYTFFISQASLLYKSLWKEGLGAKCQCHCSHGCRNKSNARGELSSKRCISVKHSIFIWSIFALERSQGVNSLGRRKVLLSTDNNYIYTVSVILLIELYIQ